MLVYLSLYKHLTQKLGWKKKISIQICKLGNAMNANEVRQWMLMRKSLLAMLILMLVIMILMLILMLLNLNTGYTDTDADLCSRIMSLCCMLKEFSFSNFHATPGKTLRNYATQWLTAMLIPLSKNIVPWKISYLNMLNLSLFISRTFKVT